MVTHVSEKPLAGERTARTGLVLPRLPPQPPLAVASLHPVGDLKLSLGAGVVCVQASTLPSSEDEGAGALGDFQTVKSKKQQKAERQERKRQAEEEARREASREAAQGENDTTTSAVEPLTSQKEPVFDGGEITRQQKSEDDSKARGNVFHGGCEHNESTGGASSSGSPAAVGATLPMSGGFPSSFGAPFGTMGSLNSQPTKEIAAIWARSASTTELWQQRPLQGTTRLRPRRPQGLPPPYEAPQPTRPALLQRMLVGPRGAASVEATLPTSTPSSSSTKHVKETTGKVLPSAAQVSASDSGRGTSSAGRSVAYERNPQQQGGGKGDERANAWKHSARGSPANASSPSNIAIEPRNGPGSAQMSRPLLHNDGNPAESGQQASRQWWMESGEGRGLHTRGRGKGGGGNTNPAAETRAAPTLQGNGRGRGRARGLSNPSSSFGKAAGAGRGSRGPRPRLMYKPKVTEAGA